MPGWGPEQFPVRLTPPTRLPRVSTPLTLEKWKRRPNLKGPGPFRFGLKPFYGVVVDSVNVSALEYVPVRSASLALTSCENSSVTASLEMGAL